LDEKLRLKTREIEEADGKLLERVEALTCELRDEKLKRNRVTEAYKRLKSQHVYLRRKVGLGEENVVQENKLECASELEMLQSPIVEPGIITSLSYKLIMVEIVCHMFFGYESFD